MKFKVPPLARDTDDTVQYAFRQVELYLNGLEGATGPVDHMANWHLLTQAAAPLLGGTAAAKRAFGLTGLSGFGTNTTNPLHLIRLVEADFAVAGKTTYLSIRGNLFTNATAPGAGRDFKLGLSSLSAPGGASGGLSYTEGSAVTSVTFNSGTDLSASTRYSDGENDIAFPASGWYVPTLEITGGSTAAGSHIHATARVFVYNA